MNLFRRTTLRFQEGNSDKVYEVDIVEVSGTEFIVNFRYGRSGKPLTEGSKTTTPVPIDKAKKVADSLLVSKINKGYQVIMGYDPVSGQTIGISESSPNRPTVSKKALSRNQLILERLARFARGEQNHHPKHYIDNYSLTRTLWKAGELRIPGLIPALQALLDPVPAHVKDNHLFYYCMAWAAGRSQDPQALPLLKQIQDKVPTHWYQLACLQVAPPPATPLPSIDPALDLAEILKTVQAFDTYERMNFEEIDDSACNYIQQVLHWQGLSAATEQALQQVTLADARSDYLQKYFSAQDYARIQQPTAAFPGLEQAIVDVLSYHYDARIDTKVQDYQADVDLYHELINNLNLTALLSSYELSWVQEGRLDYLWNASRRNLQNALKATGRITNFNSFWQRVINHSTYAYKKQNQAITPERLQECYTILQAADAYEEIMHGLVPIFSPDQWFQTYLNTISLSLQSKYDLSLAYHLQRLFNHRFAQLRREALQPKQQLVDYYGQQIVNIYTLAQLQTEQRPQALAILQHTPIGNAFVTSFRKLYKMAELADDYAALAVLNHRIETTDDDGINWSWQKNPPKFSAQTRQYLRRRSVRHLKHLAKFAPNAYLQLAREILVLADEQSSVVSYSPKKRIMYFPTLGAMNFILHRHSHIYAQNYQGNWYVQENRQNEVSQPEAFATLWAYAGADLLYILRHCRAQVVNDFACRRIQPQTAFLQQQPLELWLELVNRPYEATAVLAASYLTAHLHDPVVFQTLLGAHFASVRQLALQTLTAAHFTGQVDFLLTLLLSEHEDVFQFGKDYLYTAQPQYAWLSEHLLTTLLNTTPEQQTYLLPRLQWLLTEPVRGYVALPQLQALLVHPQQAIQQLGASLLAVSPYSFAELSDCFALMAISAHVELRAAAIALLAKLNDADKKSYGVLLFNALIDGNAALRASARSVVLGIQDQDFQQQAFAHILPTLFRSEPVEGFADDMVALVEGMQAIYTSIEVNLLWRLLTARSKLAEKLGALILPSRKPQEFSIKQQAMLTKHATFRVRQWAMQALQANPDKVMQQFSEAVRMLDNRWDDTRCQAITLFQQLPSAFWTAERVVAICDNVYDDVQVLGRELVLRGFEQGAGDSYLLQLSQHPATQVQLFVSSFLQHYAAGKPDTILKLQAYFKTVLSQVNRGRIIKDRVIAFLFNESGQHETVGKMVAELFSDQSLSSVVADKARYIKTLFELHQRYGIQQTPVKVIAPEVRAY